MASRPKHKMDPSERAKQFMPFAALKGLPEALAEQERKKTTVSRIELSEDMAVDLDSKLRLVERGTRVTVTHFLKNEYRTVTGAVICKDKTGGILLVSDTRIQFEDILDIKIEDG